MRAPTVIIVLNTTVNQYFIIIPKIFDKLTLLVTYCINSHGQFIEYF